MANGQRGGQVPAAEAHVESCNISTMVAMDRTIELCLWRVTDPVRHRRYVTRCRMTETDALDLDPAAEPVPGSREVRQVPTDPLALSTSGWQRR